MAFSSKVSVWFLVLFFSQTMIGSRHTKIKVRAV